MFVSNTAKNFEGAKTFLQGSPPVQSVFGTTGQWERPLCFHCLLPRPSLVVLLTNYYLLSTAHRKVPPKPPRGERPTYLLYNTLNRSKQEGKKIYLLYDIRKDSPKPCRAFGFPSVPSSLH